MITISRECEARQIAIITKMYGGLDWNVVEGIYRDEVRENPEGQVASTENFAVHHDVIMERLKKLDGFSYAPPNMSYEQAKHRVSSILSLYSTSQTEASCGLKSLQQSVQNTLKTIQEKFTEIGNSFGRGS